MALLVLRAEASYFCIKSAQKVCSSLTQYRLSIYGKSGLVNVQVMCLKRGMLCALEFTVQILSMAVKYGN